MQIVPEFAGTLLDEYITKKNLPYKRTMADRNICKEAGGGGSNFIVPGSNVQTRLRDQQASMTLRPPLHTEPRQWRPQLRTSYL